MGPAPGDLPVCPHLHRRQVHLADGIDGLLRVRASGFSAPFFSFTLKVVLQNDYFVIAPLTRITSSTRRGKLSIVLLIVFMGTRGADFRHSSISSRFVKCPLSDGPSSFFFLSKLAQFSLEKKTLFAFWELLEDSKTLFSKFAFRLADRHHNFREKKILETVNTLFSHLVLFGNFFDYSHF